jgi:hypothetical protein
VWRPGEGLRIPAGEEEGDLRLGHTGRGQARRHLDHLSGLQAGEGVPDRDQGGLRLVELSNDGRDLGQTQPASHLQPAGTQHHLKARTLGRAEQQRFHDAAVADAAGESQQIAARRVGPRTGVDIAAGDALQP